MPHRRSRNPVATTRVRQTIDVLARFTVDVERSGGWYVGQLRELPAVVSQGRSMASLRRNLTDAYWLVMKSAGACARR